MFSSHVQAEFASPRRSAQLLGGWRFPCESYLGAFQMYQSRLGDDLEERDSRNHACCAWLAVVERLRDGGRYLIGGVIDHQIHYQLHAALLDLLDEVVDVR